MQKSQSLLPQSPSVWQERALPAVPAPNCSQLPALTSSGLRMCLMMVTTPLNSPEVAGALGRRSPWMSLLQAGMPWTLPARAQKTQHSPSRAKVPRWAREPPGAAAMAADSTPPWIFLPARFPPPLPARIHPPHGLCVFGPPPRQLRSPPKELPAVADADTNLEPVNPRYPNPVFRARSRCASRASHHDKSSQRGMCHPATDS